MQGVLKALTRLAGTVINDVLTRNVSLLGFLIFKIRNDPSLYVEDVTDRFEIVGLVRPAKRRIRIDVVEGLFSAPRRLNHSAFREDEKRRSELANKVVDVDPVDLIAKWYVYVPIMRVAGDDGVTATQLPGYGRWRIGF